jgi:hypothetical protein
MNTKESAIDLDDLRSCLDYNSETGNFIWLKATSDKIKIGSMAGYVQRNGYRLITFRRFKFLAGRLAWFHFYGVWPKREIDHKNLIRDDNRIENLRDVTRQQNCCNVGMHSRNKVGFKGVVAIPYGKYRAQIGIDGLLMNLGHFDTPELAHAAYVKASQQHHQQYGRSA